MNRKPGCLRRPRARPGRLAFAIAIAVALAGCERATPPPAAPAVDSAFLLTIDTWRADHFGAGGHPGVRTPWLDRFFRGGTQFSQAYSCVPTTLASHATMLSGRWPSEHGVPRNGWPLAADVPLLPDSLADVHSGAFVSSAALDPRLGLARAFERYDFEVPHAVEGDQAWRSAGDTLARAREWWRSRAGSRRFLWVHLFEPHFPYAPDPIDRAVYDTGYSGPADGSMRFLYAMWDDPSLLPPDARDHLESLYVAEIAGLDRVVGPFLAEILAEPSLLAVITSDHGESLGEHDLRFKHGPYVYPADVRVPLVLTGTSEFRAGVSDRLVRTIDLHATLLAALGGGEDPATDSVDLAGGGRDLPVFAEASMPWDVEPAQGWANTYKQRVLRTREWSIVDTPWRRERTFYDRRTDPDELNGLASPPPAAAALAAGLEDWSSRAAGHARAEIDPELRAQLEALGYTDSDSPAGGRR